MKNKYKLRSYGLAVYGDYFYFPNGFFNGIIKMNRTDGKIEGIYRFEGYSKIAVWLHSKVLRVDNILFFSPDFAKDIVLFDMKHETFEKYAADTTLMGENIPYFRILYHYKNVVYMFPCRARCILKYDIKNKKISYLEAGSPIWDEDEGYFRQQYEVVGHKLFIPFSHRNEVMIFDLETERIQVVTLGKTAGWTTIHYVNGYMWMSAGREKTVCRWDMRTNEVEEFHFDSDKMVIGPYLFANSYAIDSYLLYFPIDGNTVMLFDTHLGEAVDFYELEKEADEDMSFYWGDKKDNCVYAMLNGNEEISKFYIVDGKIRKEQYVQFDYEYNCQAIDEYLLLSQGIAYEQKEGDLEKYLDMILNRTAGKRNETADSFGRTIYMEQKMKA